MYLRTFAPSEIALFMFKKNACKHHRLSPNFPHNDLPAEAGVLSY
jgi:hypothetical protein